MDPAANNPAMLVPASHALAASRHSSWRRGDVEAGNDQASDTVRDSSSDDSQDEAPVVFKDNVGWRRIVRNFSPSWFSVTMGTGIVAVLLISIPFKANWLYWLSIVFFVLNAILFLLAAIISILRYTLYPEIWLVMIRDPTNSLYLATIPMGFATLIRMWISVCIPLWGPWATTFAWVLWMIDTIAAFSITNFLAFALMSRSGTTTLDHITPIQILPIAATVVASSTGSVMAEALPNPQHALGTLLTCYALWGMSMPLALTTMVIYYQRLAVHKLPPREIIVSCFLPLGPLGYGGFGILYHGKVALSLFEKTNTLPAARGLAGPILYVAGFAASMTLWGFAIIWLVLAIASIAKSRPFPFNMGWWSFTFPLGVFALNTMLIGEELASLAFRVFGTIFACCVIILWGVCSVGTVKGAWNGKLFHAPCLQNLDKNDHRDEGLDIKKNVQHSDKV